jgi:hypothetical protein
MREVHKVKAFCLLLRNLRNWHFGCAIVNPRELSRSRNANFSSFLRVLAFCMSLVTGCGYHFDHSEREGRAISVSVPYIKGDLEGHLNAELIRALTHSGHFDCVQNGGELLLEVAIIGDGDDRIGYRFDRNPESGELRDNIVGTENRRTIIAVITLIDSYTHTTLLGPQTVKMHADYDYVDSNSIRDLTFITINGVPEKVLDFSLGQLDSVDGAYDDTSTVIYRNLAQKIVDGLLVLEDKRPMASSQSKK